MLGGTNGYTRDEWLHAILYSGEVTRIGQHLALVIYHLADTATNIAEMSLRDLEKITGWNRQAIRDHVDEIDIFVRVTWGAGRAKSVFEMQGVIADAMDAIKAERDANTPADFVATSDTTTVATNFVADQGDATVAATVATTVHGAVCGQPRSHNENDPGTVALSQVATNVNGGGTIGGGRKDQHPLLESLSQGSAREGAVATNASWEADATPPPYTIEADGSFAGQAFELSPIEFVGLQTSYNFLPMPAELIAADAVLAGEFAKSAKPLSPQEKRGRLHQYLAAMNRKASAQMSAMLAAARSKSERPDDENCRFDGPKLIVANGFKAELLGKVNDDEVRLRKTLDKIGASVPIDLKGLALQKVVLGHFSRQIDWDNNDERKTVAVEKRTSATKPASKTPSYMQRY